MIHFNIDNLDAFQNINQIVTNHPFALEYNLHVASAITNDYHVNMRTFYKSDLSFQEFCQTLDFTDLDSSLVTNTYDQYLHFSATQQITPVYFPLSSKNFCSIVFTDCVPTLAKALYVYLIMTRRIHQFGSGQGKALIYYPVAFTEEEFQAFLSTYKPLPELVESFKDIVSAIGSSLTEDVEYITSVVATKDQQIIELIKELSDAQESIVNAYRTTWR